MTKTIWAAALVWGVGRIGKRLLLALLLVGSTLVTRSGAQTAPGDPYLCYTTKLRLPGVLKTLEDQFRSVDVTVPKATTLCNPTQTASHATVHQIGYKIREGRVRGEARLPPSSHVVIDQFGQHVVQIIGPVGLFAPSASVAGSGGTGTVDTTGVDHFECYRAALAPGSTVVSPPLTV